MTTSVKAQNARNWIITQHDLENFWRADPTGHYAFKYFVYQVEVCPKTGAWHVQAFIQFKTCVKGAVVQKLMGGGNPHIEVAHHPAEAREYCMKDETRLDDWFPIEYGVWDPSLSRGFRTDLTVAKYLIREHGDWRKCLNDDALDNVTSKYPKWCADQLTCIDRPIRPVPNVTVYYGPTLTGKTQRCHLNNPGIHELRYDNNFMNYSGQTCVLFDEFDKDPWPFGLMLKLLDRYPFQVNVKNGYAWWNATDIYFTATEPPSEWYILKKGVSAEHIPQFLRRLTSIICTAPVPDSPDIFEFDSQ